MSNLEILVEDIGGETWLSTKGWSFQRPTKGTKRLKSKKLSKSGSGSLTSPMPGQLLKVFVEKNQTVKTGDVLCVVEAMKMEHSLKAPFDGTVTELNFQEGANLDGADIILVVAKKETSKDAKEN